MAPPISDKISRVIIHPVRNFVLKMNVRLMNKARDGKQELYHREFDFQGKHYTQLNANGFLTMEITGEDWSPDKSIMINQHSLYSIINAFHRLKHAIYHEKIFAVKENGDVVIFNDKADEHKESVNHIGNNQFLLAKAAVVYDENDVSYEGVRLFINNTSNTVDLPIDAFEALVYVLGKVDLFEYSQHLLTYYVSSRGGIDPDQIARKQQTPYIHRPVDATPKDSVSSNLPNKPKSLFDV